MGKLDLFAKRTLAAHVKPITRGGAAWKDPPEIGLEKVQSDGIVAIHDPALLKDLPPPWRLVTAPDEIIAEYKMQGDHIDDVEVVRILLRRQARELQRILEVKEVRGDGLLRGDECKIRQTLWVISGYVPRWARKEYNPVVLAPGCHRWATEHFTALWIAANEIPLHPANWPFLIARTGRPLQQLLTWARENMPLPALQDMVTSVHMMNLTVDDIIEHATDDEALGRAFWARFVNEWPDLRDDITKEAVEEAAEKAAEDACLAEARGALFEVLRARSLEARAEQRALVDVCTDVATLHKWLRLAVTAPSVDDVFH